MDNFLKTTNREAPDNQQTAAPALGTNLSIYHGHSSEVGVLAVAWSPDGRRIASGSGDKTVQVWDAATGTSLRTYRSHSYGVLAVAWSPDGRRIASGSGDKTVQVWDAATGTSLRTYRGHASWVNAVAWSPDGCRIASAGWDDTVQIWDAATGGKILIYHDHRTKRHPAYINMRGDWPLSVNAVAWSPDGRRIASGADNKAGQVWDAGTGTTLRTYRGHASWVNAVAWSPDGCRIASGSTD